MNLSKKKIRKKMIYLRKSKYVLDEMTPWKAATNFFLKYRKNYKNIATYWLSGKLFGEIFVHVVSHLVL